MYCKFCGKKLNESADVCRDCSRLISEIEARGQTGREEDACHSAPPSESLYAPKVNPCLSGSSPRSNAGNMPKVVNGHAGDDGNRSGYTVHSQPSPYEKRQRENDCRPAEDSRGKAINGKYGFGKALASVILIFPSIIFCKEFIVDLYMQYLNINYYHRIELGAVLVSFFFAAVFISLTLIFGIQSLNKYSYAKQYNVKPVATLVLGTISTVIITLLVLATFITAMVKF